MSYCQNCGTELQNGTNFCPKCGTEQNLSDSPVRPVRNSGKRLHCPNCRSVSISPIVETEVNSGLTMSHSVTRRTSVSSTGLYNTHRNYWVCQECGHKFRNLQNLEEELKKHRSNVTRAIIGIILIAVIMLASIIISGFGFLHIIMLPALGFIIFAIYLTRNKIASLEKERAHLKKHCFN